MRETNRTQGVAGLFMTTALKRSGAVKNTDLESAYQEQKRNGARIRSTPIRRIASQAASIFSESSYATSVTSVSEADTGKAAWEATPYVKPTRATVPKRHCLTPKSSQSNLLLSGLETVDIGCVDEEANGIMDKGGREAAIKGVGPTSHPQEQSGLFKLPRALRLMIYEEVLGAKVLRIKGAMEGKLGCVAYKDRSGGSKKEKQPDDEKTDSWLSVLDFGAKVDGERNPGFEIEEGTFLLNFLPLLQSCRAIYADAIPLLYTTTTFSFTTMEAFVAFSRSIPACRFDSINSLLISFTYDLSSPTGFSVTNTENATPRSNWPRWERTWRVIDSMAGLKTLKVRLDWGKALFAEEEERLLGPICGVRGIKVFEVEAGRLMTGEKGRFTREEREKIRFEKRLGIRKTQKAVEVPFRLVRRED